MLFFSSYYIQLPLTPFVYNTILLTAMTIKQNIKLFCEYEEISIRVLIPVMTWHFLIINSYHNLSLSEI